MPLPPSRSMVLSPISFRLPIPMDPYVAGGTTRHSGRPDWVLLHKSARISGHRNSTISGCHTMEGHPIEVSFWLVDPPGVSYFSVHCPGLNKDFHDEPYIICAEAALVLFSVAFVPVPGRRSIQHFVYRAGPGAPALELIPDPDKIRRGDRFGLLPCGDSEHYALVFLNRKFAYNKPCRFDLHIFSSATQAWSSKVPSSCLSEDDQALLLNHGTCKSVMVGDGSLGWVDLFSGILLLCDVFGECPVVRYITLPASRTRQTDERGLPYFASEYCCNVSCRDDGAIKFVEIEFDDPDRRNRGNQGWRAIIWDRTVTSDGWSQRFRVDAANISVDPSYSDLLPELWNGKTGEPELKRLIFYTPTLSKHDDDLLYMMSKVNKEDDKAWVITVDMKREAVEAIAPYSTKGRQLTSWHCPCTFPKYIDPTTSGDHVAMHSKRISAADCVLQVLLSRDWFREIDERLEIEMPTYHECVSLLDCCPASSVLLDIQEVVKYASSTDQGKAAPQAVESCSRALEEFEALVRGSVRDPSSSSTEGMRSKISVALRALDNILDIVPPTLRALADACHQKGGKTIFDLVEQASDDTEECKLEGSPDADNLSHGENKTMVYAMGRSCEVQQGRPRQRRRQNQARGQEERAVVPNRRQLEQYVMMIFLCLLFFAYIWAPIDMRLLGHCPLASY
ncbi:unnamed protein product [Triticum turgidum subsp. durum]|uniref:DUF1618 domain-containing protein n=2 Tax=Triticum turgidum subsp. durum TaxID=4567 RepID=A0A9R1NI64_TRITD|nr:unnamed protein product [Triticum turgidum subsp. durum]